MRYFLDTEFFERPNTIEMISIGIVAEDGREFYAENALFDWAWVMKRAKHIHREASDTPQWLLQNVYPHLGPVDTRLAPQHIGESVRAFVGDDPDPQFWGWYADYDWVVFCWLQGRMIDLPKAWPKYCRDLKQVVDQLGVRFPPDFARTAHFASGPEHNALADARELNARFEWVCSEPSQTCTLLA